MQFLIQVLRVLFKMEPENIVSYVDILMKNKKIKRKICFWNETQKTLIH